MHRVAAAAVTSLAAALLAATLAVVPTTAHALPASYLEDAAPRPAGSLAVVGDSLTIGYWGGLDDALRQAGFGPFRMEARSARRTLVPIEGSTSGIDAVRHVRHDGFDPTVWVVALGTNDINPSARTPGEADRVITTMLDEIGPGHLVVWVNVWASGSDANAVAFNERLAAIAQQRPGVYVADWHGAVAANRHWMRDDGVHTTMDGAVQRNRFVVAQALWAAATTTPQRPVSPGPRVRETSVWWRAPEHARRR